MTITDRELAPLAPPDGTPPHGVIVPSTPPWAVPSIDALWAASGAADPLTVMPPRLGDRLPTAPAVAPPVKRKIPWRLCVRVGLLALAAGLAVILAYEHLVSGVIFEQRQRHLSADYQRAHPTVSAGQAVAVLQIPKIGLNVVVAEGESRDTLRGAPGHRAGSAVPGGPGTSVILGHRGAYGGPFAKLDRLAKGDQIAAQTKASPAFVYTVTEVIDGAKEATANAFQPADGEARLVLITDEKGWFADHHIVVIATGVPVLGGPRAEKVDPALDPLDGGAPFGAEALVANLAIVGAVVGWVLLRGRVATSVIVAVLTPMAILAALTFAMAADGALPGLR